MGMIQKVLKHCRRTVIVLGTGMLAISVPAQTQAGGLDGLFNDLKNSVERTVVEQVRGTVGDSGGAAAGQDTAAAQAGGSQSGQRGAAKAPHPDAHHVDWDTKFTSTGLANRKLLGHHFKFYCPPAPSRLTPRHFKGTDRYAFHTLICRAGVHAGRISLDGGNVTLRMEDGNMKLTGSTRNGFTTKSGYSGVRTLVFVN